MYRVIGHSGEILSACGLKVSWHLADTRHTVRSAVDISKTGDIPLSDKEFERLRGLVRAHTSIELPDIKRGLVHSRFLKRLKALGLSNFDQYCDLIDNEESPEIEEFVNAITTNFTRFFREQHHFDYLRELLSEHQQDRKLRIWSAGCATGEEPYSIAMALHDLIDDIAAWDIRILATDIDTDALRSASEGIYPQSKIDDLDERILKRWFQRGRGLFAGRARVQPALREMISFKELNLFASWPMSKPFDIIFCRNVVIYFGLDAKKALFARFAEAQRPGDYLFAGHSENIGRLCDRYKAVGNTVYRRV